MQRRLQVDQPPQAFASCIANFLMVTGYSSGAPLPETAARYHEGYLRDYQPFERAFPLFMENYLLNFVFRTRFPFADTPCHIQHHIDPLASSLLLLLHYRLLHSLLIGEAARCGATFSTAGAVRVVQGFARGVEHNVKFHDDLMIFARSPELQKSDGLAVLVRN
jgi:lysine-N-methylase